MEVDGHTAPAPSQPTVKKGKGKVKATSSARAETADGDGDDSDVDMRDAEDVSAADGTVAAMAVDGEEKEAGRQELDVVGLLDSIPREPVYMVWPLGGASPTKGESWLTVRCDWMLASFFR